MAFLGSDTDVERGVRTEEKDLAIETEEAAHSATGTPICDKQSRLFARVQQLTERFGVEQRGIERVLPDERTDTSVSKVGTLVRTNLAASKRDRRDMFSAGEIDSPFLT